MNGGPGGASEQSVFRAFGDAVADFFVDVVPVFECTLQSGLGYAILEMAIHVGRQPIPLGTVHP